MRLRVLITAAALMLITSVAGATGLPVDYLVDPLHGYCSIGCIDNGAISPTNNLQNFGFDVSPASTPTDGDYLLVFLIPNNEDTALLNTSGIGVAGTGLLDGTGINDSGTATLVSATNQFNSDGLANYLSAAGDLNAGASPANPIGAYLNPQVTTTVDPGATGYFVFVLNLGQNTLQPASNPNFSPLDNITTGILPVGTVITAYLTTASDVIATAPSSAIVTYGTTPPPPPPPPSPVPEPSSLFLLGTALIGVARKFRKG